MIQIITGPFLFYQPYLNYLKKLFPLSQFYDFLSRFKLLHGKQSGFRPNHSCQTALLQLVDLWLKEMENGNFTGILFLDFQKVFDVVNHKILLIKLKYYKCDDLTISWFKSYLGNRCQIVRLGLAESKMEKVQSGVPQDLY